MSVSATSPFLPGIVKVAAQRYGDRTAFRLTSGSELSYRELDQLSDQVASGLASEGLGDGDVLLLSLPSGLEYAVSYVAAAKIGVITAGANPQLLGTERFRLASTLSPDFVLATEELASGLEAHTVHIVESTPSALVDGHDQLLATIRSSATVPFAPADPNRPTCICFTSGSTGDPRGAWFTDRQLAAIQQMDTGGAWGIGDHMVSGTAFAHVGVMTKLPWQLASGATIHIMERWSASGLLDLIQEYRLPVVNGVATQVALLLREPGFEGRDLSSVGAVIVGGGPSSPRLVEEARSRFNAPYSIRYSSTESGGIGLATALDAGEEEALHTVGRPRLGVSAEVRDFDGRPITDSEVGELWLRSPSVMSGYWKDPVGTTEVLVDDWLRTGDLARIDSAGCVRLAGRTKEMYIRGGYNVYPLEVEAVLSSHPAVAQVAVIPRPDPVMGEIGIAVVVPTDPNRPPDLDDLLSQARSDLSRYKLPEDIRILDALPLNASGKLDRRSLQAHEMLPASIVEDEPGLVD